MINTQGDIINDVLVQSNVSTTAGFYTDSMLSTFASKAQTWAAARHKWPFTEGRVSTTFAGTEENGYPEGWKPDSIRILQVGGKLLKKVGYADFLRYKEDYPQGTEKIYSDHGGLYFINTASGVSGTTVLWGQFLPPKLDATDTSALTVFSGTAEEGNEAIVEEMISYCLKREKNLTESVAHHQNAVLILDGLWKRIQDEQYQNHTIAGDGMFKRFSVVEGGFKEDIFKRDQF